MAMIEPLTKLFDATKCPNAKVLAAWTLERQKALSENARGGHWWLAAFGAGFRSHGALLDVA